jgi:membrane protein YqaA with SNARE-associated domain
MQTIVAVIAAGLGIAALLFLAVILGTVIGGIVGWVIGGVFPFVIVSLNTVLGLSLTGFEMGAVLGFVGSFLSTSVRQNKD